MSIFAILINFSSTKVPDLTEFWTNHSIFDI